MDDNGNNNEEVGFVNLILTWILIWLLIYLQQNRCVKSLRYDKSRFMEDFEPENSERQKRKRSKLIDYTKESVPPSVYDEKGAHIFSGINVCDCLVKTCPGCHFPCKRCKSSKCGHECRSQRKWVYEEVRCQSINSTHFVYIRKYNPNWCLRKKSTHTDMSHFLVFKPMKKTSDIESKYQINYSLSTDWKQIK